MPINNFVLATEPLGAARARALIRDDLAAADTKFVVDYYRRGFPADLKGFVRKYMLRVYPQLAEARIDCA